jgi:hypothetical protein
MAVLECRQEKVKTVHMNSMLGSELGSSNDPKSAFEHRAMNVDHARTSGPREARMKVDMLERSALRFANIDKRLANERRSRSNIGTGLLRKSVDHLANIGPELSR